MYYYKEHTADFIIGLESNSMEGLYEDAAKALFFSFFYIDFNDKNLNESYRIVIEGEDEPDLLVSFLNELIYLFEVKKLILWKIEEVKIKNNKAIIKIVGEKYDHEKYKLKSSPPKAATYHNLVYKKENGKIKAEVVIDI